MRIKLRYLVRSCGPNFIPSVRGPVRLVRSEKYTQPLRTTRNFYGFLTTLKLFALLYLIHICALQKHELRCLNCIEPFHRYTRAIEKSHQSRRLENTHNRFLS